MPRERICPHCSFRTSQALPFCPVCEVPLEIQATSNPVSRQDTRSKVSPLERAGHDGR